MATDKLFHQYAIQFGESLLRLLDIEDYRDYKAVSFAVKDIERRSDIVFENQRGRERAIWIEFQGYRDVYVFYRMNIAITLYCEQREFFGELLPMVIFLRHSYLKAAKPLIYNYKGRKYLSFEPEVIVFDKKLIEELQALDDVRLVPFYPLCKISAKEIETHASSWAEEIQQAKQLSTEEKIDVLALLGGFISHRLKKLTLKDINQLLGGFKMEETRVGKDLIEIGIEKGFEKGIEKGLEKGIEKGKQQTLVNLLSYKFGKIPEDVVNRINSISDGMKLDDLTRKVLDLTDLDQLKKHLN